MRAVRCDYGRLHYAPTGMSRLLRSQYLLTPLTGSEREVSVQHMKKNKREAPPDRFALSARALFQIDIRTCQPLIVGAAAYNEQLRPKPDIYYWLELCQCADLYSYMAERLFGEVTQELREVAKKETMVASFGTAKQAISTAVGRIIHKEFPSIWDYLRRIKKGNYRQAAWTTQKTESKLVIDRAIGHIMRNYHDIPIATVHDAILCSKFFVKPIEEAIVGSFIDELGVKPQLKTMLLSSTALVEQR